MRITLFITLTLAFFCVSKINGQQLEIKNFFETESITKAVIPDTLFFDDGVGAFITESGDFFYVDNGNYSVFHFNSQGDLIRNFGQEGRGPGDFFEANHIQIINNDLYLLDYKNSRIQVFDISNGKFKKTINLPFSQSINSEFLIINDRILLLGNMPENDFFIHELVINGVYKHSFGEFIDFSEFFMTPNGKMQLTQLHATFDDNQIIYTLGAPYRMFSYSYDNEILWESEDPILPKPWEDYIVVTPTSYRAKFYPTSFNSEIVGNFLIIYWLDPEKEEAYLDLRRKDNGELIQRSEWSFTNALIKLQKSSKDGLFYALTKNRETSDLYLHELIINK